MTLWEVDHKANLHNHLAEAKTHASFLPNQLISSEQVHKAALVDLAQGTAPQATVSLASGSSQMQDCKLSTMLPNQDIIMVADLKRFTKIQ